MGVPEVNRDGYSGWQLWLFPSLLSVILIGTAQYSFLLFHTLAEFFAIIISFVLFAFAWTTYRFSRNAFLIFLACGYLWVGALDLMHTLSYKGMSVFPEGTGNQATQFWIGARYFEALLLLAAPIAARRKQHRALLITLFGLIAATLAGLILSGNFPQAFIDGEGLTRFKINSEYLIIFILLLALVALSRLDHAIPAKEKALILAAIVFTMCAELAFTFYISVYGLSNLVGHLLKIFSFWFIFHAIVLSNLSEPFYKLKRLQEYNRYLFKTSPVGLALCRPDGVFVDVNDAYATLIGRTVDETLKLDYWQVTPDKYAIQEQYQLECLTRTGEYGPYLKECIRSDGSLVPVQLHGKLIEMDGEEYIWSSVEDVSSRKQLEALQAGQQKILELISRGGTSLDSVFATIIQFAEEQYPAVRGSILRLEENRLFLGAAPSMPAAYNRLIDGIEIGPQVGSCGTAAYHKRRVIVSDVASDPLWANYRHLGREHGFSACWSEPIFGFTGGVLGTFALYRDHPGHPGTEEIHITETMARLAGIAIERLQSEQRLAQADSEWTQAMDQLDDAVFLLDMQRHLLRANKTFYRMINSDQEHGVGRHIVELVHPEGEKERCAVCRAQEAQEETVITLEPDSFNNPSGKPIEATLKLVRNSNGESIAMLMSLHDLSRSRKVEERLRLSASVFENTDEGVVITDANGLIIDVNRAFSEITGYSREEVIGQNPSMWKSGRQDESFYRDMWRSLIETGQWKGELWNRRKDGSIYPVWSSISSVNDKEGNLTHYVGVSSDISHIKQSQDELTHLAHHDALTNLPNRLLLIERLDQAVIRSKRHSTQLVLIFLDLDQFKHINDSLGHPVGDQLLQEVAGRLLAAVRQEDTVARIGGDEFVLLLEDIGSPEHAGVSAQKLISVFDQPFRLDEHEIRGTASMGICLCPQDGDDSATLLRNADAAMYRAKEAGRNTYQFYTEELTRNAFERVLLENSLRQAISKEQLYLVYQPQVDLQSGRIIGVEALIRWLHPELGIISPAKFIPMAEESGLILPIGAWVLRTACLQGQQWRQQGVEVGTISVNIAGPQIQRGNLLAEVESALGETGYPAELLELEVTEGFIMQNAEQAVGQLNALRALGLTLSIDDFGTGYSSLSYLKQLPIHKLKIDQSFVRDITVDKDDRAITDAVIALGRSLGLTVIAEGVETEAQAAFLKQAQCQEAQGYLYSKPLSPGALEQLIQQSETIIPLNPASASPVAH